jgi:hypothetical protein
MSANTIAFTNPGEIDVRSISSFGVSVKEGDSPIGFFGTGLKYAIAVLLRLGHRVSVLSGVKHIEFGLKRDSIRGKEFDFVTMAEDGGEPLVLGFTTELGKQWAAWMAFREIACNCKDENGSGGFVRGAVQPIPGSTQVIVTGEEFAAAFVNRNQYMLEDEPSFSVDDVEVRQYGNTAFFYRGVRVHHFGRVGLHTYNCQGRMTLTEDRTLKEQYTAENTVRRTVMRSTNREFIRRCITAHKDTLEGGMDYHGWSITPSKEFLEVVGETVTQRLGLVNETAVRVWKDNTKQVFAPKEIYLTKVQLLSLEKALDFCATLGFQVRGSFPITFTDSLGEGVLGLADADQQKIFIAERVFQIGGTKQLAATLIEEFLHLRHGWLDMSREMQNFLFEKVVSLGEELAGEPL